MLFKLKSLYNHQRGYFIKSHVTIEVDRSRKLQNYTHNKLIRKIQLKLMPGLQDQTTRNKIY